MDSPVMKCLAQLCAEFDKYADCSGIVKGKQVDKFMECNFGEWMKNPSNEDVCKELKAKVDAEKEKGIDKDMYAGFLCLLLKACCENKVGLKETPEPKENPAPKENPEAKETPAPKENPEAKETPAPKENPEAKETPASS